MRTGSSQKIFLFTLTKAHSAICILSQQVVNYLWGYFQPVEHWHMVYSSTGDRNVKGRARRDTATKQWLH